MRLAKIIRWNQVSMKIKISLLFDEKQQKLIICC